MLSDLLHYKCQHFLTADIRGMMIIQRLDWRTPCLFLEVTTLETKE